MLTYRGFTLVELAIALTIIGLLIGGVLKGQEMINNARVTSAINQISSIKTVIVTFQDKYAQYPGNFSRATRRLPGCNAASNCIDGNGDETLGQGHGSIPLFAEESARSPTGGYDPNERFETGQFWKHLALAELITGVDPSAPVGPGLNAVGVTHPASPFKGLMKMGEHACRMAAACGPGANLTYIPLGRYLGFQANFFGQNIGAVPARLYSILDNKIDDGDYLGGEVYAIGWSTSGGLNGCDTWDNDPVNHIFDPTSMDALCVPAIRMP